MKRISGTPAQIAARLRRRVREEVGLPITVGVARTKFLAKVASGVGKPDGLPSCGEVLIRWSDGHATFGSRT
jgi:DNA polymerase IV